MDGDDVETLKTLLRTMWRIRVFELRALRLFEEKLIRGSVHSYIGMEAIAAGVCSGLVEGDFVTSTHRGHGHCIAQGLDPRRMMAELLGRRDGYCAGKGGSMHITALDRGMLGADGVVGGSVAIAVGAAHAARLQRRDGVVVSFFGDGAANEGLFHEAANLAAVLKAPVIFVCENNEWALSTPVGSTLPIANVADRASSYGFPGVIVDGNDVSAVRKAALDAIATARAGRGPTLIEAKSYRISPHSAATPADPRSLDELDRWRANDPITRLAGVLAELGVGDDDQAAIRADVEREIEAAVEFAIASPVPDPDEALEDVYAPSGWGDLLA